MTIRRLDLEISRVEKTTVYAFLDETRNFVIMDADNYQLIKDDIKPILSTTEVFEFDVDVDEFEKLLEYQMEKDGQDVINHYMHVLILDHAFQVQHKNKTYIQKHTLIRL
jgi:hypothetical protein